MRLWTLLILVLIAIPCCRVDAQVKLSKQDVVIYSGLSDLRVIDGLVVADAASKPTASPAAIISVEFAKSYKIFDLEAETQAGEFVNVDQLSDKTYILKNPGVYKLLGTAYDPENGLAKHRLSVTVGGVVPVPPGPTPVPPGPSPDNVVPIPLPGLRVMIIYESQQGLPRSYTGNVRAYLDSHCVKSADGIPQRLVCDKDVPFAADADVWKQAMARGQKSLPWILISTGTAGFEGPLPQSENDMLALLKKYGGE